MDVAPSVQPERLTMNHQEMWELMGISKRQFYLYKRAGMFDHLIAPLPFRYSRAKVEAWIAGRPIRGWTHQRRTG